MPALEPFDPLRPLVANTFIRLHGTIYRKREAVPYSDADERTLRRLYELRRIAHGRAAPIDDGPRETREERKAAKEAAAESQLEQTIAAAPTEEELAAAHKMANTRGNTHEVLFKAASDLPGVTKSMNKGEIALALVRAGRVAA